MRKGPRKRPFSVLGHIDQPRHREERSDVAIYNLSDPAFLRILDEIAESLIGKIATSLRSSR